MEGQEFFKKALSNFTFDAACGGEIRHLTDLGYTVKQIRERLSYPAPKEKVQQAVWSHLIDTGVLLLEEPGKAALKAAPIFVKEYDKYGKPSFRRVNGQAGAQAEIFWKSRRFSGAGAQDLEGFLEEKCRENGEEDSYISCSFGLASRQDWEGALRALEGRQRDYIEGLPWERKAVYHRLDRRMREIAARLYGAGNFCESCYFCKAQELVDIRQCGAAMREW